MKSEEAIGALSALASESRLAVFRLLVKRGPEGYTPSELTKRLDVPAPDAVVSRQRPRAGGPRDQSPRGAESLLQPEFRAHEHLGGLPHRELLQPCRAGLRPRLPAARSSGPTKEKSMKRLHVHVSVQDSTHQSASIRNFLPLSRRSARTTTLNGCWMIRE